MPFRFLQIPARGCKQIESEMNLFLQSHRVLTVDRRLVDAGEKSFWAICIDYLEGAERSTSRGGAAAANGIVLITARCSLPKSL